MNSKQIIKKTAKWLAILVGVLILVLILVVIYGNLFLRGYADREAEGPKVFTELLQLAKESQPFNPDPYVSSLYKPGEQLYLPVLEIQRRRWDIAEKLLLPLTEQDNADALFWLAQITYGSPMRAGKTAELYMRSAKLGNPYAALKLDADNDDCQMFMADYCDEKWGKLGKLLLKKRANNGDIKAAYYLFKTESHYSEDDHKKLEQLIANNAKNYNYLPMIHYLNDYVQFNKSKYPEDMNLVIKLASFAANNNFSLAISGILYSNYKLVSSKYMLKVVKHGIDLFSNPNICLLYYPEVENRSRDNVIIGASCALAWDVISRNSKNYYQSYKFNLKRNNVKEITKSEYSQAMIMSNKLLKNMTPVIYIDEMTPRAYY